MPDIPPVNACLDCRPESSILATLASVAIQSDGVAPASQSRVVVSGGNVSVLPYATYQSILIKNTGPEVVWLRLSAGAATGANGEVPLSKESSPGAGDGGSLVIESMIGAVTAACATSSTISVTWSV